MSDIVTPSPSREEIKTLIDNALLQNNERMYDKINSAIQQSGDRTTKAVSEKTDTFIAQLTTIATTQGSLSTKVDDLESKYKNIWAKIAGALAACTALGGLLGFFIAQLVSIAAK